MKVRETLQRTAELETEHLQGTGEKDKDIRLGIEKDINFDSLRYLPNKNRH